MRLISQGDVNTSVMYRSLVVSTVSYLSLTRQSSEFCQTILAVLWAVPLSREYTAMAYYELKCYGPNLRICEDIREAAISLMYYLRSLAPRATLNPDLDIPPIYHAGGSRGGYAWDLLESGAADRYAFPASLVPLNSQICID